MRKGYRVEHYPLMAHIVDEWYVVSPREKGNTTTDEARQMFNTEARAWEVAAIRAKRAGTRESRKGPAQR